MAGTLSESTHRLMFDFDFGGFPWGFRCEDCDEQISPLKYRTTGLCNDCEFDGLTPPAWPELFLASLEQWRRSAT